MLSLNVSAVIWPEMFHLGNISRGLQHILITLTYFVPPGQFIIAIVLLLASKKCRQLPLLWFVTALPVLSLISVFLALCRFASVAVA